MRIVNALSVRFYGIPGGKAHKTGEHGSMLGGPVVVEVLVGQIPSLLEQDGELDGHDEDLYCLLYFTNWKHSLSRKKKTARTQQLHINRCSSRGTSDLPASFLAAYRLNL